MIDAGDRKNWNNKSRLSDFWDAQRGPGQGAAGPHHKGRAVLNPASPFCIEQTPGCCVETFDFVIVGAGSAGCGLAYRLAEAGHSVCVLEAGPRDTNPFIRMPSGVVKTRTDPKITWQYEIEPTAYTNNRPIGILTGKTLGGSSAVNGMVYNRGIRSDFDNWAKAGNEGWDYNSLLPYFRKSERYLSGGDDQYRGRFGQVPVTLLEHRDPISDRFIAGAEETGVPRIEDYNGSEQEGVSYVQTTIHKGRRWSSAHSYLHPAVQKFGVDVRTEAVVRRVLIENGRAVGVDYARPGGDAVRTVHGRLGVIISAGAIASPKLLQLSGLGPAGLLKDFGIPVIRELPGVGENFSDHFGSRVVARLRKGSGSINEGIKGVRLLWQGLRWLTGQPSLLALSASTVFAFCKSAPEDKDTDYTLMFLPASLEKGAYRSLDKFPGCTSVSMQNRPASRGYVRIRSKDVNDLAIVQPNYLQAELDQKVQVTAVKHLAAVYRSKALAPLIEEYTLAPLDQCNTDDEYLDYVRETGQTTFHPLGTCKMGPASDRMAVVDSRLRVHGVEGLRVVDASVMPDQPSGNLNASVMMIAEKTADMILQDLRR